MTGTDRSSGQLDRTRTGAKPGYRRLAEELRAKIESGTYEEGRKLPTEHELQAVYGVSRHTVREALQQLHNDALIYRIQGSGTYVSGRRSGDSRYLRSIGSLDEIIVWPDTHMEVLEPFRTLVEPAIARRLELEHTEVARAVVGRAYGGKPFALTRHFVSPELGSVLREHGIPSRGEGTVIGEAEPHLPRRVAGAHQDITAMIAPEEEAGLIGCTPGDAILLIERLYYDTAGGSVEFTASHFNPRRYSYRMEPRRRSR